MADFGLYPYDEGDRLDQRNTYFYSSYRGIDFLEAWAARRSECACPVGVAAPAVTAAVGPTDLWLAELRQAFADGRAGNVEQRLLARLIQRFEVSKRLHADYTPEFKPVDAEDFRHPPRYVAFAETLVAAYPASGKPQVLNALLKVMDTICALRRHLPTSCADKLPMLVAAERRFVLELAGRLGVPWRRC